MNAFGWLLRREIWEHRNFYLVPLVLATILLILYTIVLFSHGPGGMVSIEIDGVVSVQELLDDELHATRAVKLAAGALPFVLPTVLLNVVMLLISFAFLVDTLYAERKDRSVLFWKSLPVSDTATVVSKMVTVMFVIPAIVFATICVVAIAMSLANSIFMLTLGKSPMEFVWSQVPIVSGPLMLAYSLLVQSLWYAPLFGWLLLASAWARRAPALWAVLPIVTIGVLEVLVYRSTYFLDFIGNRLEPVVPTAFRDEEIGAIIQNLHYGDQDIDWSDVISNLVDVQSFLSDPQLWGGLVVSAGFVAAAVWLRRYRETV